jgi:hypothetical protein
VKKTAGIILALTAILLSCESQWTTRVAGIDPDTRDIGELNTLLVAIGRPGRRYRGDCPRKRGPLSEARDPVPGSPNDWTCPPGLHGSQLLLP